MYTDFLRNFTFSIYGESHANSIGAIINGIKPGFEINIEKINELLIKRNPNTFYNTKRKDSPNIIFESGFKNNKTTGTPLMIKINNDDIKKNDYSKNVFRLNHADLVSYQKFGENYPFEGGGPFSGRLTAIIVVIGEIARQILENANYSIKTYAQIKNIKDISFESLKDLDNDYIQNNLDEEYFVCSKENVQKIKRILQEAVDQNDALGAKIEFKITPPIKNLGNLYFNSFESILSHALFSIPGIKSIAFGSEEDFYLKTAKQLNYDFSILNNKIKLEQSINGGINGGITNGYEDIYFNCIIKPPFSLKDNINVLKINEDKVFEKANIHFTGRHDSYIANKAIFVIKAWINIILLDLIMQNNELGGT